MEVRQHCEVGGGLLDINCHTPSDSSGPNSAQVLHQKLDSGSSKEITSGRLCVQIAKEWSHTFHLFPSRRYSNTVHFKVVALKLFSCH